MTDKCRITMWGEGEKESKQNKGTECPEKPWRGHLSRRTRGEHRLG